MLVRVDSDGEEKVIQVYIRRFFGTEDRDLKLTEKYIKTKIAKED